MRFGSHPAGAQAQILNHTSKRFVSDAVQYLPATLLPSIFAMIGVTIFTRVFNPVEYGLYSLALAVVGPLVDVIAETIGQPTGRYYAEYEQRGQGYAFRYTVGFLTSVGTAISLVIGTLAGSFLLFVKGDTTHLWLLEGAAGLGVVQVVSACVMPILRSGLKPQSFRLATIVSSGLFVVFALALIGVAGRNIAWLLWAQLVANLVMLPYVFKQARVSIPFSGFRLTPEIRRIVRRFLIYGVPMMLWYVASNVLHREDVYVIGLFRGAREVGLYSVNYNVVFAISGLINTPVLLAAGPILYHQWGSGLFDQAKATITNMTELYLILGLPFVGGMYALGTPLVSVILGSQFRAGASILVPVAIGRALWGVANVGHKGLELSEKPLIIAGSALAAGVLNLGLNLVFVPIYGYIAAAYVTLVSYAVYSALIWWQSKSYVSWCIDFRGAWRYCVPTLLATVATVDICSLLPPDANLLRLLIGGPVFVCVYGLLTLWIAGRRIRGLFAMPKEA
jgi:O-antigen/teichoic acid export membrane protein